MDKTFESFLTELKNRISLYDVISAKIKLNRKGNQFWGCCPFHHEKTPSFAVSLDKGFYHCFGCGAHGDIVKFTMETNSMPFIEAVEKLANQAGLQMPQKENFNPKQMLKKNNLKEMLNITCDFFQKKLCDQTDAKEYLQKRNLTDYTVNTWKIGYAPDSNELYNLLKTSGYDDSDLCDGGLFKKSDYGNGLYAYFKNRVVFPINNKKGEVIGFSGRVIGVGEPKYLNSPESDVFEKRFILFGFDKALQASRDKKQIIAVEGNIDVVALSQAGFQNVVAPLGTAMTEYQVSSLWQTCNEPIICFDGDTAGKKAAVRLAHRILPYIKVDKSLKFCILSDGLDPDNIINQENGNEEFAKILTKTTSLIDLLWFEATFNQTFNTPEQKAGLEKRLFDLIEEIQDLQVKKYYTQTIKGYLWEYFKHKAEFKRKERVSKNIEIANENIKSLLTFLYLFPTLKEKYLSQTQKILFQINCEPLFKSIFETLENDEELSSFHKSKLSTQIQAVLLKKNELYNPEDDFITIFNGLSKISLIEELEQIQEDLKQNQTEDLYKKFILIKKELDLINSQE